MQDASCLTLTMLNASFPFFSPLPWRPVRKVQCEFWCYDEVSINFKMAVCQNPGAPVVHIKIAGIYGCE